MVMMHFSIMLFGFNSCYDLRRAPLKTLVIFVLLLGMKYFCGICDVLFIMYVVFHSFDLSVLIVNAIFVVEKMD